MDDPDHWPVAPDYASLENPSTSTTSRLSASCWVFRAYFITGGFRRIGHRGVPRVSSCGCVAPFFFYHGHHHHTPLHRLLAHTLSYKHFSSYAARLCNHTGCRTVISLASKRRRRGVGNLRKLSWRLGNMTASARRLLGLLGAFHLGRGMAATGLPSGTGGLPQPDSSASRPGAAAQLPEKPLTTQAAATAPAACGPSTDADDTSDDTAAAATATADVVLPADESVLTQGCTFFLVRRESVLIRAMPSCWCACNLLRL